MNIPGCWRVIRRFISLHSLIAIVLFCLPIALAVLARHLNEEHQARLQPHLTSWALQHQGGHEAIAAFKECVSMLNAKIIEENKITAERTDAELLCANSMDKTGSLAKAIMDARPPVQ